MVYTENEPIEKELETFQQALVHLGIYKYTIGQDSLQANSQIQQNAKTGLTKCTYWTKLIVEPK